tara:strand:- start:999 stop:1661 length:663 start_codon:yes stop_codon:yes gene_type:complete
MAKKIKFNVVNKLPVKVGAKNKPKKKIKFNVVKRKPIPTPRKPIPAPRKKKHPYAMGDTKGYASAFGVKKPTDSLGLLTALGQVEPNLVNKIMGGIAPSFGAMRDKELEERKAEYKEMGYDYENARDETNIFYRQPRFIAGSGDTHAKAEIKGLAKAVRKGYNKGKLKKMGKKIHRGEEALEDYRDDHRYDYMGGSDKYRLHYRNLTRHSPEIKAHMEDW